MVLAIHDTQRSAPPSASARAVPVTQGSPVPCVVLDPFCGSGTTVLVARELGRHGIGLDASGHYLHTIARKRLGLKALARWHGAEAVRQEDDYSDLPLFPHPHAARED